MMGDEKSEKGQEEGKVSINRPVRHKRSASHQLQDGMPSSPFSIGSCGTELRQNQFNLISKFQKNHHSGKPVHQEKVLNSLRSSVGLYRNYPLADSFLAGAETRETALKSSGIKQLNHVRGTDSWWRTVLVLEVRAIDKYLEPWMLINANAVLATLLSETFGVEMNNPLLSHWDAVYSLVLKTSLAFLLVFRLNRVAMRYWETRTMWGNITHNSRNLIGGILTHCRHDAHHRDQAVKWASSFCVAAMHFIRNEAEISTEELSGILSRNQIDRLQDANHPPLFAASMARHHAHAALKARASTPAHVAHANAIHLHGLEELINSLVTQVSGLERIRSTPLPIVYVTHLRTFLFCYCIFLPYVWVNEWGWATIPLVAFTAFALLGIEGASSECEIPFDRSRPNHLAMDGYCLVILDSIQGLVVHDANMEMQEAQNEDHFPQTMDGV